MDRRLFLGRALVLSSLVVTTIVLVKMFHYYDDDNDDNHNQSSSNNRRGALVVMDMVLQGCIMAIAACFFLYDVMVKKEFLAKKDLLQAKRRFMRFVFARSTHTLECRFHGFRCLAK